MTVCSSTTCGNGMSHRFSHGDGINRISFCGVWNILPHLFKKAIFDNLPKDLFMEFEEAFSGARKIDEHASIDGGTRLRGCFSFVPVE